MKLSQIDTENFDESFYARFFPIFDGLCYRNVKKGHQEKMRCAVGLSEEFIAGFHVKMSQIDTKNDKKTQFFYFRMFNAFFVNLSTKFVTWNVLRGQHRVNNQ